MRIVDRPQRTPQCLSDLMLDRLDAGELTQSQAQYVDEHLRACAGCRARHDSAQLLTRAYFADAHSDRTLTQIKRLRAPGRSLKLPVLVALATAAAIVLAFVPPRPDTEVLRKKGGLGLSFFVKRDERVFRGEQGEYVQPGDQLRFTLRPERVGHIAILSLDARGVADVYYPVSGAPSKLHPQQAETALATSIELDEVLGEEREYALFCEQPPRVVELQQELARQGALAAVEGCQMEILHLVKVRKAK